MTSEEKIARLKRTLTVLIAVLFAGGILIATLPTKLPPPLRYFLAATDIIAAAFLWVAMRQQSAKK